MNGAFDFDALEDNSNTLASRVVRYDDSGCPRGSCSCCDCLEWASATTGLKNWRWHTHPYNLLPVMERVHGETDIADPSNTVEAYRKSNLLTALSTSARALDRDLSCAEGQLAWAAPQDCLRCGCRATWHEDISDLTLQLWERGRIVEADPGWGEVERSLYRQTLGLFHPTRENADFQCPLDDVTGEARAEVLPERDILVSVICPTGSDRHAFHPFLYQSFQRQAHRTKELIVVETSASASASKYFCRGPPASDGRVTYRHYTVPEKDWSIGVKRNVANYLARGSVIVHFDDDDIYAPEYLTWVLGALLRGGDGGGAGGVRVHADEPSDDVAYCLDLEANPPLRCPGFAAEAATLTCWHTFNLENGTFGVCDVDNDHCGRRSWTFGYGFSFSYLRAAWFMHWFHDVNLGEDCDFLESLLARGARVALLRDEGAGMCAHTHHRRNSSAWERGRPAMASPGLRTLIDLGQELCNTVASQRAAALGAGHARPKGVVLTRATAGSMLDELLAGFTRPDFQAKLRRSWHETRHDSAEQIQARRRICLEVQGPVIRKYGFEDSWVGVLASTAAFNTEALGRDDLIQQKSYFIMWLANPARQILEPMGEDEFRSCVAYLRNLSKAQTRREG